MATILVVEDQSSMRKSLAALLRRLGHKAVEAAHGGEALACLEEQSFDLVITDLRMKPVDGMEVLRTTKKKSPLTEVVVITAYGSIDSAVKAMQQGAYDYITKPFQRERIRLAIGRVLEKVQLARQVEQLQQEFLGQHALAPLVGESAAIMRVKTELLQAARTDVTVLLTGETGTGKELVARALHEAGPRAGGPFVAVDCGAFPAALLEAELFGHAKGAFTDAARDRPGLFEAAHRGTLFLDEIGTMPPPLQAKLLRVLQERQVRRLGENHVREVDVRVVAATHTDLGEAMQQGEFREDLFYRLNVFPILLPPLRERKEDIPPLADHFLQQAARRLNRPVTGFTPEAKTALSWYDWPGNVRELENAVEHLVAVIDHDRITREDLERHFFGQRATEADPVPTLKEVEGQHIERVLHLRGWDMDRAAADLDIGRSTLFRKVKEYGLVRKT